LSKLRDWNTLHGRVLSALLALRNTTAVAAEQMAGLTQARLSMTARRDRVDVRSLAEAAEACGGELGIRDRETGHFYPLPARGFPDAGGRDASHMARMREARRG
jgi:hypothetical protein